MAIFGLTSSTVALAAERVLTRAAPELYLEAFTLRQGSTVTLETSSSSSRQTDPVLHLLRDYGNGTYAQVAYNDNWSGLEARISYTNTSASSTRFLVVLRAKSSSARGRCYFWKDGLRYPSVVSVGGELVAASDLLFGAGDALRTVHIPGQSVIHALFRFSSSGGTTLTGVALANGVGGSAVLPLTGSEPLFLVGTPRLRDGGAYPTARTGNVLLIANDAGQDTDGDGVGNQVEQALGLCSGTSGCPWNASGHGWDTDRDGLPDGEELWGVAGTRQDGLDDLPFARWGANPRKKDVFLEVDFKTGIPGLPTVDTNPFQVMRDSPTTSLDGWTGTPEAWVQIAREPLLAGPAAHLHQPAGMNGVELHLDLGVAPISPADEAKFGAWPTGTPHALAGDFIVKVLGPINGEVAVAINGQTHPTPGFDATGMVPLQIAWFIGLSAMGTGQPVAIREVIEDPDTGSVKVVVKSTTNGVHFDGSLFLPVGFQGAAVVIPENHDDDRMRARYDKDPGQVDAVRVGRFHYAVIDGLGEGGQTMWIRQSSGLHHVPFMHEFGHSLGTGKEAGHATWNPTWDMSAAPACLPHYQSVMRYATNEGYTSAHKLYQYSAVEGSEWFNPAAADEGVRPANPYFPLDGWPYFHTLFGATGIDWTRDGGQAAIPGLAWRSTGLSLYESSCGAFSQGKATIAPDVAPVGPPDLVRARTRLYAFWSTGAAIRYKFASLGSIANKSCTGHSDPTVGACLSWSDTFELLTDGSYDGVSAHVMEAGSPSAEAEVLVATRVADGPDAHRLLVYPAAIQANGQLLAGEPANFPNDTLAQTSSHVPELVRFHSDGWQGDLALLYLARTGTYSAYRYTGGSWSNTPTLLLPFYGLAVYGNTPPAAVAWPDAYAPGFSASDRRTVAVLSSTGGDLAVYVLNPTTGRWETAISSGALTSDGGARKPTLAFRPIRRADGWTSARYPGHFMVGWMGVCGSERCGNVQLSGLVAADLLPGPSLGTVPVRDFLESTWAVTPPGTGAVALFGDSTLGTVFGLVPRPSGLELYPHADGAPNHAYRVASDFRAMEDELCHMLNFFRPLPLCGPINTLD